MLVSFGETVGTESVHSERVRYGHNKIRAYVCQQNEFPLTSQEEPPHLDARVASFLRWGMEGRIMEEEVVLGESNLAYLVVQM